MTITLAVTSTGSADQEDARAVRLVVNEDNLRRAANNQPPLPISPAANLRASYLTVRGAQVQSMHIADVARANTTDALKSNGLTQEQVDQLSVAASDRMNNGESFQSVLTDLQTP